MELVIKLYNDKAPRMGIVYPTEFQAHKAYETLIENNKGETFKATIELLNDRATLTLISINGSARIIYKALEYKTDQLKKLQAYVKADTAIQFVHVYWKANTIFQAKVRFKNPELFFIKEYEII